MRRQRTIRAFRAARTVAFLAVALALAAPAEAQRFTYRGRECRVKTDLDKRTAQPIAERIDNYCGLFREFYDALGLESRHENKAVVRIFAKHAEFEEFTFRTTQMDSAPAAYFSPSLNGIVSYHDATDPYLRQVLFHEMSHQYLDRYAYGVPKWANEGLAEYFEGWQLSPEGALIQKRPAFYDLLLIQKALKDDEYLPLKALVEMPSKVFMDFQEEYPDLHGYLHYATSWSLVYFSLHGPDETARKRFVDYLRRLNERKDLAEPMVVEDWDALEKSWREYVLGLEISPQTADDHQILAASHRDEKEWAQAIAAYEAVLEREPDRVGPRYWIGYCYKRSGKYDEAKEHLLLAHAEDESDPWPAYHLARIVAGIDKEGAESRPEEALRLAQEASERAGDENPRLLAFVAEMQDLAGDPREAARTMRKVLKLVRDEEEAVQQRYREELERYDERAKGRR